jgi:hypothetical protein
MRLNKLSTYMISMVLVLSLSACGYQLRGISQQANLPSAISIFADETQLANAVAEALSQAQVKVTLAKQVVDTSDDIAQIADVRFVDTKTKATELLYDDNGEPTLWRYSINTTMLLGNNEDTEAYNLQEYTQVELSMDTSSGSANDLIISTSWDNLYTAIGKRALSILSRQP